MFNSCVSNTEWAWFILFDSSIIDYSFSTTVESHYNEFQGTPKQCS